MRNKTVPDFRFFHENKMRKKNVEINGIITRSIKPKINKIEFIGATVSYNLKNFLYLVSG